MGQLLAVRVSAQVGDGLVHLTGCGGLQPACGTLCGAELTEKTHTLMMSEASFQIDRSQIGEADRASENLRTPLGADLDCGGSWLFFLLFSSSLCRLRERAEGVHTVQPNCLYSFVLSALLVLMHR